MDSKPVIALLPGPGIGHLVPILELAKRLVTHHGLQVSIYLVSSSTGQSPALAHIIQSANSTSKSLNFVHLPPVDLDAAAPPQASLFSKIFAIMRHSMPALKSALSAPEVRPAAFIADHFGAETLEVAKELGIPKYMYLPLSAWVAAVMLSIPVMDKEVTGQYTDQTEPIRIPGCRSLKLGDFPAPMNDRTSDQYEDFVRMGAGSWMADGFLVNTWEGLESSTLAALREGELGKLINKAPVYGVGPILKPSTGSRDHELFGWLDKQPVGSVVYACFGSAGTLSPEQTNEIALGLELSRQRFMWVVRPPVMKSRDGAFFSAGGAGDDPSSYLPDGFLGRTREVGLVIPQWAPQVELLGHPSIGAFVSHCGWNSSLEAIVNGVPVITLPLFAEQMTNATLLVEELGVAVRPKFFPSMHMGGVVGREEIAGMIRRIVVDEEEASRIRTRAHELKRSGENAVTESGTSFHALSRFAHEIRIKSMLSSN